MEKVFSFRYNSTTLYLYIIKCEGEEDGWQKLQKVTNMANERYNWKVEELKNSVNCIQ